MRTSSLIIVLIVALSCSTFAQVKVPTDVQKAFKLKYASATSVKWDKENDTEFEAEFKMNNTEMSANFSEKGVWMETEIELTAAKLPAAVTQRLAKDFKGFKVKEASSVEKPGKEISYEVEITKGEKTMEVLLAKDGKVIEKKTVEEEEEGDEDAD